MTIKEVTEALDFCSNTLKPCEECPLPETDRCSLTLMRESLRIIQQQQAEIAELREIIREYEKEANQHYIEYLALDD